VLALRDVRAVWHGTHAVVRCGRTRAKKTFFTAVWVEKT
jgi:hypothetical protein